MNFPMDNSLMQFLFWLVNTPGVGGVIVFLLGGGSVVVYALTLRWIQQGGKVQESDTYAYPTPALHVEDGER